VIIEQSRKAKFVREMIAHFTELGRFGQKIKEGKLQLWRQERPWHCPRRFVQETIQLPHYSMEMIKPKVPQSKILIFQIHGGGYIGGFNNDYRNLACEYSDRTGGLDVLSIDYRLAPEHAFPKAFEDVVHAYRNALGMDYEDIIVVGDSAGGGLAFALTYNCIQKGLKKPLAVIAMSPWTDLTLSGESLDTNYTNDPLFGNTRDSLLYNRSYVGTNDPKNPYLSPLFATYTAFPPLLIQVGSYEMLLSDATRVAQKAKAAGVDVTLSVYPGMFHNFQKALHLFEESIQAWKEVADFLSPFIQKRDL